MRLKEKTIATLLIAILTASMMVFTVMAGTPSGLELDVKNDGIVSWSEFALSGERSAHLIANYSTIGSEARIIIPMPDDFTLADLESLSWWTYVVEGSTAHVDIILDLNNDDIYDGNDDALVIQYAYNDWDKHYLDNLGDPSYGAETGDWYKTFGDDGDGPDVIDDDAMAWATKGAAGAPPTSPNFYFYNLADWKTGKTYTATGYSEKTIDASSSVLRLEIEVDSWGDTSEVYVDDIEINGKVYDLELPAPPTPKPKPRRIGIVWYGEGLSMANMWATPNKLIAVFTAPHETSYDLLVAIQYDTPLNTSVVVFARSFIIRTNYEYLAIYLPASLFPENYEIVIQSELGSLPYVVASTQYGLERNVK